MFINYHAPTGTLSIDEDAGYAVEDIGWLADCIQGTTRQSQCASCPLEGAKYALEDGEYWQGSSVTAQTLEEIHNLIIQHESK